jgi:hypothetical protein
VFGARELRAHLPECLKTSKTAKMAKRKNAVKIGTNWRGNGRRYCHVLAIAASSTDDGVFGR